MKINLKEDANIIQQQGHPTPPTIPSIRRNQTSDKERIPQKGN